MTTGGNNFNDFPENQLNKFRAVYIIWGNGVPQKILGERRSPSTTPLPSLRLSTCDNVAVEQSQFASFTLIKTCE